MHQQSTLDQLERFPFQILEGVGRSDYLDLIIYVHCYVFSVSDSVMVNLFSLPVREYCLLKPKFILWHIITARPANFDCT